MITYDMSYLKLFAVLYFLQRFAFIWAIDFLF